MGDSVLVNGLLTRLDAVTAQMGVAATEVWDVWLATAWIGFVQYAVGLSVALAAVYAARRAYEKNEGYYADDFMAAFCFMGAVVASIAILVCTVGVLTYFPYLFEPRLYALEQLRGLVGR